VDYITIVDMHGDFLMVTDVVTVMEDVDMESVDVDGDMVSEDVDMVLEVVDTDIMDVE
jgi:hypothetical protein